jgi:RNA polymerase sigma-70 factor (ECF subfamily)
VDRPFLGDARLSLASPTLVTLFATAQQRDPLASDALLRALRPLYLRYFQRVVSLADAEDLAQDALIRIARVIDRLEPARAPAYVAVVGRNVLRRALTARRHARERHARLMQFASPPVVDPQLRWAQREHLALVATLVQTLPSDLRRVVRLVALGYDAGDIAAHLGLARATVRTRLHRARRLLRAALARVEDPSRS